MEAIVSAQPTELPETNSIAQDVAPPASSSALPRERFSTPYMGSLVRDTSSLDPDIASALGFDGSETLGIFRGLRAVFLLYLGVGVVAAMAYEIWCLLTR